MNLMPFRKNRGKRSLVERGEDPFNSLISDFFSDMVDVADIGFKTDIREDKDNYYIEAELPGLSKEDINLEIEENNLIISATNEDVREEKNDVYLRRERRTGKYQRAFAIDKVKEDDIKAEYNDGILTVTLPKETPGETGKRRVIDIE